MTFADYEYTRPDLDATTAQFEELLAAFREADAEQQVELVSAIKKIRSRFATEQSLCHIRHTADTRDAFYEAENAFFDEAAPRFEALVNRFNAALVASPHRDAIQVAFGPQFIRRIAVALRAFDESTLDALTRENQLASAYTKLKARAQIEYGGRVYNLSSIQPLLIDPDREVRAGASAARWAFYSENGDELDRLFDDLVAERTGIARAMGHDNFVALGYDRMGRTDYGPTEVAAFRRQVRRHIVPLATELYARQARRLDRERLGFVDEGLDFPEGNPTPRGSYADTVAAAAELYGELSKETDAFFAMMRDRRLMDLEARDGKATGGYCTYLYRHCLPFVFANFNGTAADIDVLTHEIGHAFQMYQSRRQPVMEYILPTYEACEIHSMGMEFFAYPWMEGFFGRDGQADRYRLAHAEAAVKYLPYICCVDEFQHRVYAEPDLSPAERRAVWRELESAYLPHRDYEGEDFLLAGGLWQRQSHVYQMPFYYIDYALAQVCAFQLWARDRRNHREAWADYLRLCRAGGSGSFLELVELGHLRSPFAEGTVAAVVADLRETLDVDVQAAAH